MVGPYKIAKSMGRGLYQIQDVNDSKQKLKVHGIHLKPFHPSTKVPNNHTLDPKLSENLLNAVK